MSKAVTKTNTQVQNYTNDEFDAGYGEGQDILIPKILLMQGQSDMVLGGDASFGEFRNSVTKEKLGDTKSAVKILPFYMTKTWIVSKKDGERWVYHGIEDYDATKRHEFTEEHNGEWFKYEESLNFYCFLKDSELPIIVSFKSTSKRAGQNIYTQMYVINKSMKKLPFSTWFDLKAVKETKNGNTYAKSDVVASDEANNDDITKCKNWFGIVKQNSHSFRVDDSEHTKHDDSNVSF